MNPLFKQNLTAFIKQNAVAAQNMRAKVAAHPESRAHALLPKEQFRRVLVSEKKRAERAGKKLLLLLIDHGKDCGKNEAHALLNEVARYLSPVIRETDIGGWFEGNVLGVIFTEFGDFDLGPAAKVIEGKVTAVLQQSFQRQPLKNLHMSFYAFPDSWSASARSNDLRDISAFTRATPGLMSKARNL